MENTELIQKSVNEIDSRIEEQKLVEILIMSVQKRVPVVKSQMAWKRNAREGTHKTTKLNQVSSDSAKKRKLKLVGNIRGSKR